MYIDYIDDCAIKCTPHEYQTDAQRLESGMGNFCGNGDDNHVFTAVMVSLSW